MRQHLIYKYINYGIGYKQAVALQLPYNSSDFQYQFNDSAIHIYMNIQSMISMIINHIDNVIKIALKMNEFYESSKYFGAFSFFLNSHSVHTQNQHLLS